MIKLISFSKQFSFDKINPISCRVINLKVYILLSAPELTCKITLIYIAQKIILLYSVGYDGGSSVDQFPRDLSTVQG